MKKAFIMLILLAGIAVSVCPVAALTGNETTLSFNEQSWFAKHDIEIDALAPNGTWMQQTVVNSTTTGIVLAPGVYSLLIRTSGADSFANPMVWVQDGFTWVTANAYAILFIILCIGILIGMSGGGRRSKR